MVRILAFDSGIGGLGIVRCLRNEIPDACIDYLADTAVFPYGEQPDDFLVTHIVALVGRAIERLQPDLVVIACNTASTLALDALRARYRLPFVGCVPPIKWAADLTHSGTIGLLATRATVSRPYLRMLQARFALTAGLSPMGPAILRIWPNWRSGADRFPIMPYWRRWRGCFPSRGRRH